MEEHLYIGVDVGSTTVKLVVLDETLSVVHSFYRRHQSNTLRTVDTLLRELAKKVGDRRATLRITGSGGLQLSDKAQIRFVQEVAAVRTAVEALAPGTNVVIELGGEDAKIVYLDGAVEERMNGSCAGGTGAFIDQMATLLQTDAAGIDALAVGASTIYPIAARCGVFAKTDIQPLLNEGARREDIAASVLQSVVTQTISGLACGRPIRGNVLFLGGPLNYLPQLRVRFRETLDLDESSAVCPENAHLFVAIGAAMSSVLDEPADLRALVRRLDDLALAAAEPVVMLPRLFESAEDHAEFSARHRRAHVERVALDGYQGPAYLGIDAGSTTFKLALAGEQGQILYSHYGSNNGDIVGSAVAALGDLYAALPAEVTIRSSLVTGYGESLLKAALCVDRGEIETIAHARAAREFAPDVDFILDIGGQDMKCLHLKDGVIDRIMLNEACSSGCGSFIQTFATTLGLSVEEFVAEALAAEHPVDLGSRCTVFMNSRVRQAQNQGATVADIAAGLCYSVVKNALYKVIRITDSSQLGKQIVVQGGTFANDAVLRAFEQLTGREVVRPDVSALMGAWGAALLARDRAHASEATSSALIPAEELRALSIDHRTTRCRGCSNSCRLTVTRFDGTRTFVSGNRCERGAGGGASEKTAAGPKLEAPPNLFDYKYRRLFDYTPLPPEEAPLGVVGLPRALNMYENYPFWFTFFTELGFSVMLSDQSTSETYRMGIESMPSESVCYPAKLSHGHIENLIGRGARRIFMPCVREERREDERADNCFNCPVVQSYSEVVKLNTERLTSEGIDFRNPFVPYNSRRTLARLLAEKLAGWGVTRRAAERAVEAAWAEDEAFKADVRAEGKRALEWVARTGRRGVVLAGRPYHLDPEINHAIPQMIARLGLAVLTEDSVADPSRLPRPIRVFDQWMFHSRLYSAAAFVAEQERLEYVQLNSFGCGLDALTIDQVAEILSAAGKIHTVLKIDEISNVAAARIRIRSLVAALDEIGGTAPTALAEPPSRASYTPKMRDEGWTILAPQMAPIHFALLGPVFHAYGYNIKILEKAGPGAVEEGLRHVNNDSCYPSIMTVGQIIEALKSGDCNINRTAVMITQTGGICRATNYLALLRKALADADLEHVPVISLSPINTGEENPGFRIAPSMLARGIAAIVAGDTLSRCLHRTRPYEREHGAADALAARWTERGQELFGGKFTTVRYARFLRRMVAEFDALPLQGDRRPRVGIVGEILVKYHPDANNHLVDAIEAEGCEAIIGDMIAFIMYSVAGEYLRRRECAQSWARWAVGRVGVAAVSLIQRPARAALRASKRFEEPEPIRHVIRLARSVISTCNSMGEGWLLTGEMRAYVLRGIPNIVCVQPFACLPNHVVGRGVIKEIRRLHPEANVVAVDYDPGASETNQINRLRLMLTTAKERHGTTVSSVRGKLGEMMARIPQAEDAAGERDACA